VQAKKWEKLCNRSQQHVVDEDNVVALTALIFWHEFLCTLIFDNLSSFSISKYISSSFFWSQQKTVHRFTQSLSREFAQQSLPRPAHRASMMLAHFSSSWIQATH
jgi:hypothetical protein